MRVEAVCVSEKKGGPKTPVDAAVLEKDRGFAGDAHAGPGDRQVSLLAVESLAKMRGGCTVKPGDCAENILTSGVDWPALPVGTRFRIGDAVLEITRIGKECVRKCAVYHRLGDCILPREGAFARVLRGGVVRPGDAITMEKAQDA